MSGKERREQIVRLLSEKDQVLSGSALAGHFDVSRQVIVQDIALLRANGMDIISTNRGYVLQQPSRCSRVFKVQHKEDKAEEEMFLIVDYGGTIEDVFIYHRVYGIVRAPMQISTRREAAAFLADIRSGKSSLLSNVTDGYHYHTVTAPREEILDLIKDKLAEHGLLAKLQDFEPVDFWSADEGHKDSECG